MTVNLLVVVEQVARRAKQPRCYCPAPQYHNTQVSCQPRRSKVTSKHNLNYPASSQKQWLEYILICRLEGRLRGETKGGMVVRGTSRKAKYDGARL